MIGPAMNSGDPVDVLRSWLLENPGARVPLTLATVAVLIVLPLVGFAAYVWRMAARAFAERTFPPDGYRIVGRTPAITGDDAIRYARVVRMLAIFLVVAAVILAVQLGRFAMLLRNRA